MRELNPLAESLGETVDTALAHTRKCEQSLDALRALPTHRRTRDDLGALRDEVVQIVATVQSAMARLADVESRLASRYEIEALSAMAWLNRLPGWLSVAARCCEAAAGQVRDELRQSWLKRRLPEVYDFWMTFFACLAVSWALTFWLPQWWNNAAVVLLCAAYVSFRFWVTRGPAPWSLDLAAVNTSTDDRFDVDSVVELDAVLDGLYSDSRGRQWRSESFLLLRRHGPKAAVPGSRSKSTESTAPWCCSTTECSPRKPASEQYRRGSTRLAKIFEQPCQPPMFAALHASTPRHDARPTAWIGSTRSSRRKASTDEEPYRLELRRIVISRIKNHPHCAASGFLAGTSTEVP